MAFREKRKLEKMAPREFLAVICEEERFAKVMRTIREIDRERNGYITN
jgi:nicotinamide mononucleotide adenylyltransferase